MALVLRATLTRAGPGARRPMKPPIVFDDDLLNEALAVPPHAAASPELVASVMHQIAPTPPRRFVAGRPLLARATASLVAAGVLGALLATMLLLLILGSRQPATSCAPPTSPSAERAAPLPEAGSYVSSIPRDAHQDIQGVAGDTLWLGAPDTIARLDPMGGPGGRGVIDSPIPIPDLPTGIPPRPGGWWISSPRPNSLVQFFPDTGTFGTW